jgi:VWFA-related protein
MPSSTARVACAGFVALACLPSFAQEPAPSQQPPIRTGVNLVRVDAYPTHDGKPVLDLGAEDFEVLEDGAPQRIESFEHVVIQPAGPQDARVEPNSQRQMLQAAANPRNRVFVIFLDTPNVSIEGAHHINEPLIRLIDRVLGPDDLVGVMTPAMSATNLVLGRKTQVIEESLRRNWPWGTRHTMQFDEREENYIACFPPLGPGGIVSPLAAEMILRKRERATLEALQDLVSYLHGVREERKAILTVTEGWLRYRESKQMTTLRQDPITGRSEPVPGVDPIGVGPTGQPVKNDPRQNIGGGMSRTECDTERMRLAMMDNWQFFLDLLDDANRANASFYPIDPRGLVAFDTPIRPMFGPSLTLVSDRASLKSRQDAMHELAINTDGIAVMDTNDLDKGLRRISDDLTSYYLLGYYSTNTKLDGRFRHIRVRVKRPGVQVRARRGYRAATAEEAARAVTAAAPPDASTAAFTAALGTLDRVRPDTRFRINAAAGTSGIVWVAGEVLADGRSATNLSKGSTVDVEVAGDQGSGIARVTLKPGERAFLTPVKVSAAGGTLDVRARFAPDGGAVLTDTVRLDIGPAIVRPLLFRRGPTTGNRVQPAADFRFSRMERLRIEIPVAPGTKPGAARFLDRTGKPLEIPIAVSERTDEGTGQQWIVGDVALAPLAASDYGIEMAFTTPAGEGRVITAIRVTR